MYLSIFCSWTTTSNNTNKAMRFSSRLGQNDGSFSPMDIYPPPTPPCLCASYIGPLHTIAFKLLSNILHL